MSGVSAIQWTDRVWNPVVGCTKVSAGCRACYAKTLHDLRHKAYQAGKLQNVPQYAHPFETVQTIPDRLGDPLRWRKPARIFVNSMSDLFHEDVPDAFIDQVFAVMSLAPRHTFQILTKRPDRMLGYLSDRTVAYRIAHEVNRPDRWGKAVGAFQITPPAWPLPNAWLGVSVENQAAADERIPLLLRTPAAIRFLSCEPLLGPVDLTRITRWAGATSYETNALTGQTLVCMYDGGGGVERHPRIEWVIVGGESGPKARQTDVNAIESLVAQCRGSGVAVFVKQLGARPGYSRYGQPNPTGDVVVGLGLRDRHGGDPEEWPEDLRVRQFPVHDWSINDDRSAFIGDVRVAPKAGAQP